MPDNKTVSLGMFAAAAFATVICMPVSAAGMVDASVMMAMVALMFAIFGFVFAGMSAREEEEAEKQVIRGTGSKLLMQEAVCRLNEYEEAQRAGVAEEVLREKREIFTQAAVNTMLLLGEISVSNKDVAMVSVSKAIAAQKELMRYTEQNAPKEYLDQLQRQAETLSRIAVRDLRVMLQERAEQEKTEEE